MMDRWMCVLLGGLLWMGAGWAQAQPAGAKLLPADGIPSNFVQVLEAEGDSLWIGPLLHLTTDGGQSFAVAEADSLLNARNQVFALDVEGPLLWAGLAFATGDGGSGAGGFVFSEDGGETFTYRFPPLDALADTTVTYGGNTLRATPITAESNSAPTGLDVAPDGGVVWSANGFGGIRRSVDRGQSWQRVVLPPDDRTAIFPDSTYDFVLGPPSNRGDGSLNHVGFSLLVDETGTVWAGTAGGVNRSRPEDVTPDGRIWQRFAYEGTPGGLTGNRVVALAEQPQPGRNPVWMATWAVNQTAGDRQRFGATVTRDGGATFETALVGTRIFDFAFHGGRVYAAGGSLYISDDGGRSWRTVRSFPLADDTRFLPPDPGVRAVATTRTALWVGTEEGLLRQRFGEETWTLFRADVPLDPATPTEDVPRVDTYAYPNPFSPAADRVVRIRYPLDAARTVEVRIFDFNMNLIRRIVDDAQPLAGQDAAETAWDGTDGGGLRLPNGPYFYTVDVGGRTVQGKILLVE
jgi:hypothetical protein